MGIFYLVGCRMTIGISRVGRCLLDLLPVVVSSSKPNPNIEPPIRPLVSWYKKMCP